MDLPNRVRVGPVDYEIVGDGKTTGIGREGKVGKTDHMALKIIVDANWSTRTTGLVLLHEILHAAFEQWHLDVKASQEQEEIVGSLESALGQIWRDNPTVIRFLDECLQEENRPALQAVEGSERG